MKQQTLAMANGFEQYAKKTRRARFLEEMEQVVPWAELCRLIEPLYPKAGNGRPPVGLERMLRVYFLQQAALAHQGILRHQRECSEDSNLDRGVGVRARGDRTQAIGTGGKPLPNSTDSQRDPFRENAHFTGTSGPRLSIRFTRSR